MTVDFFRFDREASVALPTLPASLQVRCWQPGVDGYPPRGSRSPSNHFWWALARTGRFARPGFAELRIEHQGRLLHRLIVTPAWYRFPFMGADDLQIGSVWSSPSARRRQLARIAIGEAHRRFGKLAAGFWYIADAENSVSAALARSCGYRLVATGRRTRRFGTRLLGQFVIDRFI